MPFDIGSLELLLIAIVALLVIGPERLPEVAAKIGSWVGKVNRFLGSFKDDINRELKAEELKRTLQKQADVGGIHEIIEDTRDTLDSVKKDTKDALDDMMADAPEEDIAKLDKKQQDKPK
jgi:sec-independent protein translocase protein TatB